MEDIYSLLDAMDGADEVYHCAGMVSFHPKDKKELFLTNAEGTSNIVSAALEKNIRKFCHVSSIAALGLDGNLITGETFWKSSAENSSYAISKYGGEREIWRGIEEGLNAVIVNPSVILGPGNWNTGSTALFRKSYHGLKFYTEGTTGFVDVRDVAAIMTLLMNKNILRQRFIVSSENKSFREFFDFANTCFHQPKTFLKTGKGLSELACRTEIIRSSISRYKPLVTKETARASQLKKCYSNTKLKTALDYSFIPVEQSIKDTCSLLWKEWKN